MANLQTLKTNLDAAILEAAKMAEALGIASNAQNEAQQAYDIALAESIQSGTLGFVSSVSSLEIIERNAGIQGAATFIQANPTCTLDEAVQAWTTSAIAATELQVLIQNPNTLFQIYATNLHNAGVISDTTWESLRSWIIATPIAEILAD